MPFTRAKIKNYSNYHLHESEVDQIDHDRGNLFLNYTFHPTNSVTVSGTFGIFSVAIILYVNYSDQIDPNSLMPSVIKNEVTNVGVAYSDTTMKEKLQKELSMIAKKTHFEPGK